MGVHADSRSLRREFEDTLAWYALLCAERDLYRDASSRLLSVNDGNFDDSILDSEVSDVAEQTYEVASSIVGHDIAASEANLQHIEALSANTEPTDPEAERQINEDCDRIAAEIAELRHLRTISDSNMARNIKDVELILLEQEETHLCRELEETKQLLDANQTTYDSLCRASQLHEARKDKTGSTVEALEFVSSLLAA